VGGVGGEGGGGWVSERGEGWRGGEVGGRGGVSFPLFEEDLQRSINSVHCFSLSGLI
jgi:hypothetical protein